MGGTEQSMAQESRSPRKHASDAETEETSGSYNGESEERLVLPVS